MASVDSTGTLPRPDHPALRPTAPLPAPAVEALARPELAFRPVHDTHSYSRMTPEIRRAVIRFENASETVVELTEVMDSRNLTVPEFSQLKLSEEWIAESRATLAAAGMLHLIEVQS